MDILEYIGVEEQQLLTSIIKLGETLDILKELDIIYQAQLPLAIQYTDDQQFLFDFAHSWLSRFVHTHLYISSINLFRLHISECFASMRAAIDATLSAYVITKEPNRTAEYIKFNNKRRNIFLNIKKYVKGQNDEDASKYPLAPPLLASHEMCSQFGAHADFASSFNRLQMIKEKDHEKMKYQANIGYFQVPPNDAEFFQYYLKIIDTYLKMLIILHEGSKGKGNITESQWEEAKEAMRFRVQELEGKCLTREE